MRGRAGGERARRRRGEERGAQGTRGEACRIAGEKTGRANPPVTTRVLATPPPTPPTWLGLRHCVQLRLSVFRVGTPWCRRVLEHPQLLPRVPTHNHRAFTRLLATRVHTRAPGTTISTGSTSGGGGNSNHSPPGPGSGTGTGASGGRSGCDVTAKAGHPLRPRARPRCPLTPPGLGNVRRCSRLGRRLCCHALRLRHHRLPRLDLCRHLCCCVKSEGRRRCHVVPFLPDIPAGGRRGGGAGGKRRATTTAKR